MSCTVGRRSAYGRAPSPSLKLSTNSALWRTQQDDIDFDCGGFVEGLDIVHEGGELIFQCILATASGRATKSELHGYGQNESCRGNLERGCEGMVGGAAGGSERGKSEGWFPPPNGDTGKQESGAMRRQDRQGPPPKH